MGNPAELGSFLGNLRGPRTPSLWKNFSEEGGPIPRGDSPPLKIGTSILQDCQKMCEYQGTICLCCASVAVVLLLGIPMDANSNGHESFCEGILDWLLSLKLFLLSSLEKIPQSCWTEDPVAEFADTDRSSGSTPWIWWIGKLLLLVPSEAVCLFSRFGTLIGFRWCSSSDKSMTSISDFMTLI